MPRFTSISRLTDERSRHVHPVPFIILGLGGRNNFQFGRASDMICHAGIHHESLWPSFLPSSSASACDLPGRPFRVRLLRCVELKLAFCHFLRLFGLCTLSWHGKRTTLLTSLLRIALVLTVYRALRPSKNAIARVARTRQRQPRASPRRTKRQKASSA
jgi:hypothetical protein